MSQKYIKLLKINKTKLMNQINEHLQKKYKKNKVVLDKPFKIETKLKNLKNNHWRNI